MSNPEPENQHLIPPQPLPNPSPLRQPCVSSKAVSICLRAKGLMTSEGNAQRQPPRQLPLAGTCMNMLVTLPPASDAPELFANYSSAGFKDTNEANSFLCLPHLTFYLRFAIFKLLFIGAIFMAFAFPSHRFSRQLFAISGNAFATQIARHKSMARLQLMLL